jgi:hypothetical protein
MIERTSSALLLQHSKKSLMASSLDGLESLKMRNLCRK